MAHPTDVSTTDSQMYMLSYIIYIHDSFYLEKLPQFLVLHLLIGGYISSVVFLFSVDDLTK